LTREGHPGGPLSRAAAFWHAKTEIFAVGMMCAIAVMCIGVMATLLWPYSPLTFRSLKYADAPSPTVCPGEGVPTNVSYRLEPDEFDAVASLEIVSNWIAVDVSDEPVGTRRLASDAEIPNALLQPGDTDMRSRILRPAPVTPGVWRLTTESTTKGSVLGGVFKSQTVLVDTPGRLTVLPADHPDCVGKPQGLPPERGDI